MTRKDLIVLFLTLQILVLSFLYCRNQYRLGYYQGQQDVYQGISAAAEDGDMYLFKGSVFKDLGKPHK